MFLDRKEDMAMGLCRKARSTMKKLIILIFVAMLITLLVACGQGNSTGSSNNPNTVRTEGGVFNTSAISIKKGDTITFYDDVDNGGLHILVTGQGAVSDTENGAPDFGGTAGHRIDVGESWTTQPWTTAGIYHVTCTVHPNMNLTVTVH